MVARTKKRATRSNNRAKAQRSAPPSEFCGGWAPRPYQQEVFNAVDRGVRYFFEVWHRRAGKDSFGLNLHSRQLRREVGTYWHLFPLHVQARRAIWKGMDNNGLKFLDQAFPNEIRRKVYETDMMIEFENGSTWQMIGSDYYDRLVGSNVRGVLFSEWALCDPRAWNYVRPIIRQNKGWAGFITTFRGRNHAYQQYQRVSKLDEWHTSLLTVDDTTDNEGNRILTPEDIEAERREGMSEAMIQQEYYCNPLASADGAIYGGVMSRLLQRENQVADWDPRQPVTCAWSLKYHPVNICCVFAQGTKILGSRSFMFESFSACLAEVEHAFPWQVGRHVLMPTDPEQITMFTDAAIWPHTIIEPSRSRIVHFTDSLIEQCTIDSASRPFDTEGNNLLLVEALNGYSARETNLNTWSLEGVSEYHYLTSAFETYAVWFHTHAGEFSGWGPAPNYKLTDRRVI